MDRRKQDNKEQKSMFPKREERTSLGNLKKNRPRQERREQEKPIPQKNSVGRFIDEKIKPKQKQPRQNEPRQREVRPRVQNEWIPEETFVDRLERFWDERKDDLPLAGRGIPKAVFAAVGAIILVLVLYFAFAFPNGTAILIDGNRVGIIEQRNISAEDVIGIVEEQLASGSEIQINETITTESIHIGSKDKKDVATEEYMYPKIRDLITYKVGASVLYIDGSKELAMATEDALNAVLEEVQSPYLLDGIDLEVSFVETVKQVEEFVEQDELVTATEALISLQNVRWLMGEYTVKQGDALYTIAANNNTTVEEILELNPGMTVDTGIYVGEVLNIMISEPKLSVKTIELQEYTTIEPKEYEYQYDSSLAVGQKQVLQQGRAGQKNSIIQVTRINGFVVEEKEISKEIIVEPITEIIVEGTG